MQNYFKKRSCDKINKEKIVEILKNINELNINNNYENSEDTFNKNFQKHMFLIDIAINQIKSRCKKIELDEPNTNLLNMVCACLVNLWLNCADASTSPTGTIKANGYRISKNSKEQIAIAKKLFDHWRSCAAHLLIDEGFAFYTQKELIKK